MTGLSQAEIARRAPVWCAMADLFRDTAFTDLDVGHVARTVRGAGFSIEEAEAILRTEVAPVFHSNLLAVAGEWAGWRDEFVVKAIRDHLDGPRDLKREARSVRRVWALIKDDWAHVRAAVESGDG
jgi:hypothetical protein